METLKDFLELQKELDDFITEGKNIPKKELLTDTLLALQVEVSELANETRAFKHWSNKGMSEKSVILEEYVDVFHFFLSLGNQLGFTGKEIADAYLRKRQINIDRQNNGY